MSDAPSHDAAAPALTLDGDIDVSVAADVLTRGTAVLDGVEPGGTMTISLADVTFIDSSGLSALLQLRRACQGKNVTIVLDRVPRFARDLLAVSGLSDSFQLS